MAEATIEEQIHNFDIKVKRLKLEYEKYFLGSRPNEPVQLRSEVKKLHLVISNTRIQNTALRFRFNSINSRFQAFRRQWDETCRQIDAGTYKRHVFKANLRDREKQAPERPSRARGESSNEKVDRLLGAYQEALSATGANPKGVTREKLQRVIDKQEAAIKKKLGCDEVAFRVVVQDGKVKLKAGAA